MEMGIGPSQDQLQLSELERSKKQYEAQMIDSAPYKDTSQYHKEKYNEAVTKLNFINQAISDINTKITRQKGESEVKKAEKLAEEGFAGGWSEIEDYLKGEAAKRGGLESGGYLTSLAKARAGAKTDWVKYLTDLRAKYYAMQPTQQYPQYQFASEKIPSTWDLALQYGAPIAAGALTGGLFPALYGVGGTAGVMGGTPSWLSGLGRGAISGAFGLGKEWWQK